MLKLNSIRRIEKITPYVALLAAPVLAVAQGTGTVQGVLQKILTLFGLLIPILLVLATIVFIWGIIVYITAGPSEDKKSYGKYLIMYGLIALFAIVAIWGVVRILATTFGVGGQDIPIGPGVGI